MIESGMNLESQIRAINALDCIISNSLTENNTISEESIHTGIIKNLFDYSVNIHSSKDKMELHPYIYQSFKCFIALKKIK